MTERTHIESQLAILIHQNTEKEKRLDELAKTIAEVSRRLSVIETIANRSLGLFFGLALIATGVGTFWEKLAKVWGKV